MTTKKEFLQALRSALMQARVMDVQTYLQDYEELIDDKLESGEAEAVVIADLGSVAKIVADIRAAEPTPVQPGMSTASKVLLIILLVLGSPIWASLLLFVLVILLLVYLMIWLIPFIGAVLTVSGAAAGVWGAVAAVVAWFKVGAALGLVEFGVAFVSLGLVVIAAPITWFLTKNFWRYSVRFSRWLFRKFRGHGRRKEVA